MLDFEEGAEGCVERHVGGLGWCEVLEDLRWVEWENECQGYDRWFLEARGAYESINECSDLVSILVQEDVEECGEAQLRRTEASTLGLGPYERRTFYTSTNPPAFLTIG